jgi:hypothetical protein
MEAQLSWLEKRKKMRGDIAEAFASRTGTGVDSFLEVFYDSPSPPAIGEFIGHYIPDADTLVEILNTLSKKTGLTFRKIRNHLHREESFAQFGEHLLRAGAYRET